MVSLRNEKEKHKYDREKKGGETEWKLCASDQSIKSKQNSFNLGYFLANEIFMECDGVILNPCKASFAAADCISFSNSTKAMSCLFGTRRTSLKPGNLDKG